MSKGEPFLGRRKVLKTLPAAVSTPLVSSVVVEGETESDFDEQYHRALKARGKTGSVEMFRKQLSKIDGAIIYTRDKKFPLPANTNDMGTEEAGTQKLEKSHAEMNLTLTENSYTGAMHGEIAMTIEMNNDSSLGDTYYGEKPYDIMALTWDEHHYNYTGSYYTSDFVDEGYYNGNGVIFDYDDWYDSPSWQSGVVTYYRYAGAKISPESGTVESDRQLRGTYWHTWNETEVDSVGISSGGAVTFNLKNNDKKWDRPMQALLNEDEDKEYT